MSLLLWRPKVQPAEPQGCSTPAPDVLRALVLDFLCYGGYSETARAFIRDSEVRHLDADGDEVMSASDGQDSAVDVLAQTLDERLALAERRKEVRTHILSGDIDEATVLLNRYFPAVLSPDDETLEETSSSTKPEPVLRYIPSSTVDPNHLGLNLRIQSFIEANRTIPLPYHFSQSSAVPSPPVSPSRRPKRSHSPSRGRINAESDDELLQRAQILYAEAHRLPKPEDRSKYIEEITFKLSALMVYKEPEDSELSGYLSFERREAVADQIDSAILFRLKQLPISKIELAVRYTSTLFAAPTVYNLDVKLPSASRRPAAAQALQPWLDSVTKSEDPPASSTKKSVAQKDSTEVPLPPFDLAQFLATRS